MAKDQAGKKTEAKPAKVKRSTALKRDDQNAKRNTRNRAMKSRVLTAQRHYEEALKSGDTAKAKELLSGVYSILDKAAQKGILKKNTSSRKKARLSARLSA